MYAEVARLSIAELAAVPPAPGMNPLGIISPTGGANIHFPIQPFRWGARRGKTSSASVIAVDIDIRNFPQLPAPDVFVARLENVRGAPAFQPDLHGALILSRGCDHGLAFYHIVAERFLHINIRPGLAGVDHREAMPMIRCANQHYLRTLLRE